MTGKERIECILRRQPTDRVDHNVSSRVDYETYRFFVETGLRLGRYPPANR